MSEESARPQDVGRPHRRTAAGLSPATAEILERYRAAMRAELGDLLEELRPPLAQLGMDGGTTRLRPAIADRVKLWDLAVKLGRELAAPGAADLEPDPPAPTSTSPSRTTGRAPRLSRRDRRSLGG